jgi:glycosyltransferase involved in cell wall biosynthesis
MPLGAKRRLASIARAGAAATVVPSHFLADSLAPADVLPNWTDHWTDGSRQPGDPADDADDADDPVSVGFIGRVGLDKGVHVLATACSLLDPAVRARVRLVIAGDDRFVPPGDRRTVQAALASSGVRVEQTGWITAQDFFARVDLAVVPSVQPESFGLVAAEAMSARCPVVVSDAGALAEVVGPGHPWVVPAGDAAALARTLADAIAALPATELTSALQRRWEAEYSPAAGRAHLQALVGRLVDRGALEEASPPDPHTRSGAYGEKPR